MFWLVGVRLSTWTHRRKVCKLWLQFWNTATREWELSRFWQVIPMQYTRDACFACCLKRGKKCVLGERLFFPNVFSSKKYWYVGIRWHLLYEYLRTGIMINASCASKKWSHYFLRLLGTRLCMFSARRKWILPSSKFPFDSEIFRWVVNISEISI